MATENRIDLEEISTNIEDKAEFPDDIRRQIRRLRDKLRESEDAFNHFHWYGPEYDGQEAPEAPDWHALISQATNVLGSSSKDLWVCAWLIEALTTEYGFSGFRDGCLAATILVEQFWGMIEPSPEGDDGIENTVKMISSLNDSFFIDRLNAIPISESVSDGSTLTCVTLKSSSDSALSDFVSATDVDFFVDLTSDIEQAIAAFDGFSEAISSRCGDAAPPSAKIRETLADCKRLVRGFCGHVVPQEADQQSGEFGADDSADTSGVATVQNGGTSVSSNQVQNREDAFLVLERVADYFRRSEPHSPVSYALEQAVRWGRMPLPELLAELVSEDSARNDIFKLAGIRQPNSDDDDD